jgi:hypothetical protein
MTSRAPQRFEVVDGQLHDAPAVAVRGEIDIAGIADLLFLYSSRAEAATALVPAG